MILSHSLKFIFIHVHRTGGTALTSLLKSKLGNKLDAISQHGNARTPDSYLLEIHKQYYTFGFTRNPWERILSWYSLIHKNDPKNLAEERKRFEKFIELNAASDFTTPFFHYNSIDYFANEKGELKVDKIFNYENLEEATMELFNRFGLSFTEIPSINESHAKNFREYYTDKSQQLIAEKCKKDIEYFNYTF